jgi:hypothetical protein
MDGFETLVKSEPWIALQKAEEAVFQAQRVFEKTGFSSDCILAARRDLTDANNQLRRHFKVKAYKP